MGEYIPAGGPYETQKNRARDLWSELSPVWEEWARFGSPGRDRLGVTVDERYAPMGRRPSRSTEPSVAEVKAPQRFAMPQVVGVPRRGVVARVV